MIYNTVSIENVIGRVLRNTKLADTSAIQDIYDWVPEAMELMETKFQLNPEDKCLQIHFHQARLPKGLVYIEAVEFAGTRLPYSEVLKPATALDLTPTVFETVYQKGQKTAQEIKQMPAHQGHYYYLKPGYVCTSMKQASIVLYYKSTPVDENGMPLIPDNGNYKEALYWFVRGKLIGSGQLEDRGTNEERCMQKFEILAARAINEITYPSVDKMEMIRTNQLNYSLPEQYWNNFNRI